ncbi:MAG: CARDB domain-containing protein, partial [Chitinophagaceae bacterium]
GFEDLMQDGNYGFLEFINAVQTKFELTGLFRDGYCNIYPIDRLHTGDFISERYKTLIHNLGQAYPAEREMESAWRLGKPDKTPVNYYEDGFKSSVNVLNWYWGKDVPDAPYISKPIDELTRELRLFTSVLDSNNFYRMTASHVMSDDFVPYGSEWGGQNNIYAYMLGGARGSRIDAHPRLAVGWPSGGGPDVSRLVLRADDNSLNALVYSFDDKLRNLEMCLFRINDGRYKIGLYEDPESTGKAGAAIWTIEKDLSRFDVVTLPVPPRKSLIIKVEQIKSYLRPSELPDLAIDPWDAKWSNDTVTAIIHNLGNAKADKLQVRLLDGERVIGDTMISRLDAPTDFIAKRANVSFTNIPFSRNLKIIIDPENKVREILKGNNSSLVVTSNFKSNDSLMWSIYNNNFEQAWLELLKDEYGDDSKTFTINPKELGF